MPLNAGMMLWKAAWPLCHSSSARKENMNSGHESLHDAKVLQTPAVGVGCRICCQSQSAVSHTARGHPIPVLDLVRQCHLTCQDERG